ncbi:MAG: sugar kinase [Pirellulaceae bacterium]|nr:sugar kinase [Pirellulaceae bacterium]
MLTLIGHVPKSEPAIMRYDVVTIGESMLRLTPVEGQRWEQADQFQMHVGGSESNVAAGLARLGQSVAWISRLTDNAFGRKIARSIAAHGVDTRHIIWTDEDRIGTYYFEPACAPRPNQVLYDRAASSFSRLCADMLPTGLFVPGASRYLHVSGISLALGAPCCEMIFASVQLAKQAGWKISFDVNYRAKLWTPTVAGAVCLKLMQQADLVFLPFRDARTLFNIGIGDQEIGHLPEEFATHALKALAQRCSAECIVLTLGQYGAAACTHQGVCYSPTRAASVVGRLGGGDAFAAGFLSQWLTGAPTLTALRWGNAAAQLKYTIPGDLPYFESAEVAALAKQSAMNDVNFR